MVKSMNKSTPCTCANLCKNIELYQISVFHHFTFHLGESWSTPKAEGPQRDWHLMICSCNSCRYAILFLPLLWICGCFSSQPCDAQSLDMEGMYLSDPLFIHMDYFIDSYLDKIHRALAMRISTLQLLWPTLASRFVIFSVDSLNFFI